MEGVVLYLTAKNQYMRARVGILKESPTPCPYPHKTLLPSNAFGSHDTHTVINY